MSKKASRIAKNEYQKEFIKIFDSICGRHSRYEVFQDFVFLTAIEFSNAVDHERREARNRTYASIARKYEKPELEKMASMLGWVVLGMEANPDQDFLGELYMNLDLGNPHAGQFFTPYDVCKCMSKMLYADVKQQIEEKHWISCSDPTCGAGALLVAFANHCRDCGVNYQRSVLFVCQDIDLTVGLMCYIQLSLMGCAGYVVVANSITNPAVGLDDRGLIPIEKEGQDIWFTPMYFSDVWHWRRVWALVDLQCRQIAKPTRNPETTTPATDTEMEQSDAGQLTFFRKEQSQWTA